MKKNKGFIIILAVLVMVGGGFLIFHNEKEEEAPDKGRAITDETLLASSILNHMSLEEKVGQMFWSRCPLRQQAGEKITAFNPGGYLLLADFFVDSNIEKTRAEINALSKIGKIPMAFAIIEEGGKDVTATRFTNFRPEPFRTPGDAYLEDGMEGVIDDAGEKADLLSSMGIKVLWGPVADISLNPGSFMYQMSLNQDSEVTGKFVYETVCALSDKGISSVISHFPGYSENGDVSKGTIIDTRSYSEIQSKDMEPFKEGILAGTDMILMSHIRYVQVDDEYPASLSPVWHRILREELKYNGLIVTDNLRLNAITDTYGLEESAILAIEAGNDMIFTFSCDIQIPAVIKAVESGRLSEKTIDESVLRILKWKIKRGIISPQ